MPNTHLYHAKYGARLFKDTTPEQIEDLELQGWWDSPGKAKQMEMAPSEAPSEAPRLETREAFKPSAGKGRK